MFKKLLFCIVLCGVRLPLLAQQPDASVYTQLVWENDGFQLRAKNTTDYYYTNGIRVALLTNYWQRWPTRRLLLRLPARPGRTYRSLHDLSIGQEMYTPRNSKVETPRLYPYDRPYAGYVYGSWGATVVDSTGGRRLTSSLSLGAIGPISRAEQLQDWLHQKIGHSRPLGWRNQLSNDLVISYYARYEGRLFPRIHPNFDAAGAVDATVGTLTNAVGVGGTVWLGQFNDYFASPTQLHSARYPARARHRWQVYGFFRPMLRAVLDNALLEGGIFGGRHDFYALPSVEMHHFYAQLEYGWVLAYGGFSLKAAQTFKSKEFRTGWGHQWGHLSVLWRW